VREPAYTTAFDRIVDQLKSRRNGVRVHRCYWGADYGTRLHSNGASIPGFETKRDPTALPNDEEYTIGLWSLLYQDPLLEIRLLALKEGEAEFVPGARPGEELDQAVRGLVPSGDLLPPLEAVALAHIFEEARNTIVAETDYQEMIERAEAPLTEYRIAVASALVAQSIVLAEAGRPGERHPVGVGAGRAGGRFGESTRWQRALHCRLGQGQVHRGHKARRHQRN
jgi:hypothetical protein